MGAMPRRLIDEGSVSPGKLLAALKDGRYWFERCAMQPALSLANGYGAPTGATGNQDIALFKGGQTTYHIKGAGETLLGPLISTVKAGLEVSLDQTASEGSEHLFGAHITSLNPFFATIGTSKDLFIRAKFALATAAGGAGMDCCVGIRKAEAFQALVDDYDEAVWLNALNATVVRETILNGAATVSTTLTGLTVTNDIDIEFKVQMQGRRARFFVNGIENVLGGAYQFDVGEQVVPFWFQIHGATPGLITWKEFEIGFVQDTDPIGG